jgi:hypothetical protein
MDRRDFVCSAAGVALLPLVWSRIQVVVPPTSMIAALMPSANLSFA